jgi:hypothetical protein
MAADPLDPLDEKFRAVLDAADRIVEASVQVVGDLDVETRGAAYLLLGIASLLLPPASPYRTAPGGVLPLVAWLEGTVRASIEAEELATLQAMWDTRTR